MGAIQALNALDIEAGDHPKLANILDYRHAGAINVVDLVNGLQRLRGTPRRSDSISIELVLEGMQEEINKILAETKRLSTWMDEVQMQSMESSLDRTDTYETLFQFEERSI